MLINKMLLDKATGEWNFGPSHEEKYSVAELTTQIASHFGIVGDAWTLDKSIHPHESGYLLLDSSKARVGLGWNDHLKFDDSVLWSVDWYKSAGMPILEKTKTQIQKFFQLTKELA
jgi:CDP-glucose 4,6-dehydratase